MKLEDIKYPWPPNSLRYEDRPKFGLTLNQLIIAAFAVIIAFNQGNQIPVQGAGLALGAATFGLIVLLFREWDFLGNRTPVAFVTAYINHLTHRGAIHLPAILPGSRESAIEIVALDGEPVVDVRPLTPRKDR